MENFKTVVGCKIYIKRIERKWTREMVASKAGITEKFLYEIEKGKKGMSALTLCMIAHALDVSIDWLVKELIISNTE